LIKKLRDSNKEKQLGLNDGEFKLLSKTILTIQQTSHYHSSTFDQQEFLVLLKLIQWPAQDRFPALDIARLAALHPVASSHYADAFSNGQEDSIMDILLSYLMDDSLPATNSQMIWRFLVNMFKWNSAAKKTVISSFEQVIDLAAPFLNHENKQVRLAIATILLNYSVYYTTANDLSKKAVVVPLLIKMLSVKEDVDVTYRVLVGLGTLAFKELTLQNVIKTNQQVMETLAQIQEEKLVPVVKELVELLNE